MEFNVHDFVGVLFLSPRFKYSEEKGKVIFFKVTHHALSVIASIRMRVTVLFIQNLSQPLRRYTYLLL